jgi:predicted transcriptional regulator
MSDLTKKIKKLKEAGFYPDTMLTCALVLECLEEGDLKTLDLLDDSSTSKRMLLLYYDLIRRELIETAPENMLALYKITEKGQKLLKSFTEEQPEDVESWILDWVNLWPEGVTTGGKLVRSDAKGCLKKLKAFIKEYKYSKSLIMEATEKYVESFIASNYAFMKAATYFIDKRGEGSELASWCEKVSNTESEEVYSTIDNGLI